MWTKRQSVREQNLENKNGKKKNFVDISSNKLGRSCPGDYLEIAQKKNP